MVALPSYPISVLSKLRSKATTPLTTSARSPSAKHVVQTALSLTVNRSDLFVYFCARRIEHLDILYVSSIDFSLSAQYSNVAFILKVTH